MSTSATYSVGELTNYIKFILEGDTVLQQVSVVGEISNLVRHSSGHVYFTIKDDVSQLTCVMFRRYAGKISQFPGHGSKVKLSGEISVFAPRGNYQLLVHSLEKTGEGDLHARFQALKTKLEQEGLFTPESKRTIPRFPKKIGVATSPTGAAVRDIMNTLQRRYPHIRVFFAPTVVQGERAVPSILHSLDLLNKIEGLDVIILGRGGGSLEDLWGFNEEEVVRRIRNSRVPVITGIGHETDFTLSDFSSDLRASTPTAAAEMAVPDVQQIHRTLSEAEAQLKRNLHYYIDFRRQLLDDYGNRLHNALIHQISQRKNELSLLETQLRGLDIRNVINRGFSLTYKEGQPILDSESLKSGDLIETIFKKGRINSRVE